GARLGGILGTGRRGVILFFAISGFLITTLLLREHDRHGSISLAGFYARRALRIFPLYYGVLAVYTALLLLTRTDAAAAQFFDNLPYFLTYTSNWYARSGIFAFAWSLAAEEQFYCTWPSVIRYARPKRAIWFVVFLLLAALWWSAAGTPPLMRSSFVFRVLASVQMAICWGCLLAYLLHHRRGFHLAHVILGHRLAVPVIVLATLLTQLVPVRIAYGHFMLAALVGACVVREDSWLAPVLKWRPIVHIGVVSYGIYMLHGLVFNALDLASPGLLGGWEPHSVSGFAVSMVLTTALATLSFRYFEGPFLALKSRLAPSRTDSALPLAGAAAPPPPSIQ